MSRWKKGDHSKLDAIEKAINETTSGVKEALKSKDAPTQRMALVFIVCLLGIFCTAGLWFKFLINKERDHLAAIALAQKAAKEAAADDAAEATELKKRPNMLGLGKFSIELSEKPKVHKAHGMMNLASIELYVSCDTKETCEYIEEHKVQIQNEVTGFFTPLEREEFLSISGKRYIRKALMERLNGWLPNGKIKDVYFVEIIIS